jgi:hypothetical protein
MPPARLAQGPEPRSAEQSAQVEGYIGKRADLEGRAEIRLVDQRVGALLRVAVPDEALGSQIYEPNFANPMACVQWKLIVAIVA